MDFALSLDTGYEECASDIDREIRETGATRESFGEFQCRGCGQVARMVAVGRNPRDPSGNYARGPHFSAKHTPGCGIPGQEVLIKKGVLHPAKTVLPTAATYPGRLTDESVRRRTATDDETAPQVHSSSASARQHNARETKTGPRPASVSTLAPIASHYIHYFAVGFDDRSLELPGRTSEEHNSSQQFQDAFQRLWCDKYLTVVPNKIVLAPLFYKESLVDTDDYFRIPLLAGEARAGRTTPEEPHYLRINWSKWTQNQKTYLREQLRELRDTYRSNDKVRNLEYREKVERWKAKQAIGANPNANKPKRRAIESILVFAYADPNLVDNHDLVVKSRDRFCLIVAAPNWYKKPLGNRQSRRPSPFK